MKIKTVTYQRVRNLGNYESERIEMTADIEDESDPVLATNRLMGIVNEILFPKKDESEPSPDDF